MLMLHAGSQPQPFFVPLAAANLKWRLFVDTAAEPTADIYPHADGPPPPTSGADLARKPRAAVLCGGVKRP